MRVHFVYKQGDQVSTPWSIGREVHRRLSQTFDVVMHDPSATYTITPQPGDVLLGHPSWDVRAVFNRSVKQPGWARRVLMHPFCPGDPMQYGHLAHVAPHCDAFLAITGRVWMDRLPQTLFGDWAGKVVHLDLAVVADDFPMLRMAGFAPPGQRRFVFIGNHPWFKNVPFLDRLAGAMPQVEFRRIGPPKRKFRHLKQLGEMDFGRPEAQQAVAECDFMITMGAFDANPTTLLEAMAWGLIPVAPEGSGYYESQGVINISPDDLDAACEVIQRLQDAPEAELLALQARNRQRILDYYQFDRFTDIILAELLARGHHDFRIRSPWRRWRLLSTVLRSPQSPWRWNKLHKRLLERSA